MNRRRSKDRPQNRHLRPFKKGDPNIPKSPGRPRTLALLHEVANYVWEHPGMLDEYFGDPVAGKKRLQRLIDLLIERHPFQFLRLCWGEP